MEESAVYWDHSYNLMLLVNLGVAVALFTALRLFSGVIAHIDASQELFKKDNAAFGVSVAGATFAVTLLLTGMIYGQPGDNMTQAASSIALYGGVGIALMALARIIFDKIALPHLSLRDEIVRGNMAVAIADTANVLAAAIIIRSLMMWVTDDSMEGIVALLAAYGLSQVVLTLGTLARLKLFSRLHKGRALESELASGNIALALSFAGKKIGTALAISVAASHIAYEAFDIASLVLPWLAASVLAIALLSMASRVADKIVLFGVNTAGEILDQRNIAVGALQGVIYIAIALLLAEF